MATSALIRSCEGAIQFNWKCPESSEVQGGIEHAIKKPSLLPPLSSSTFIKRDGIIYIDIAWDCQVFSGLSR